MSVNAEKKLTPLFSVTLSEELRLNENFSEPGTFFTDLGASYKISKLFHISANYRFVNKLMNDNSFSIRHVWYIDVSVRKKFKPLIVQYRTRFQGQYKQTIEKSEDEVADYYSRNKLTVKLDLDKKYSPYIYSEIYTPVNNPEGFYIDKVKYCAGAEYRINRMHSIELFYMIQKEYHVKAPLTEYIVGICYNVSF